MYVNMLEQTVLPHLQELRRNICSNKTGHFQIGVLYEKFASYMFSGCYCLKLPVPWPKRSPNCQVRKNNVEFNLKFKAMLRKVLYLFKVKQFGFSHVSAVHQQNGLKRNSVLLCIKNTCRSKYHVCYFRIKYDSTGNSTNSKS